MSVATIRQMSLFATDGLAPDLTIVLDIDPQAGVARAAQRSAADRLEQEDVDFHWRVRDAFTFLAELDPGRYLVLDATLPIDELADAIAGRVRAFLGQEVAA
jgi:dTMP kinase